MSIWVSKEMSKIVTFKHYSAHLQLQLKKTPKTQFKYGKLRWKTTVDERQPLEEDDI